jgi:hypothetical protein
MPQQFSCARGHEWHLSGDPGQPTNTRSPRCPICGAAAETEPVVRTQDQRGTVALTAAAPAEALVPPLPPSPAATAGPPEVSGYEIMGELGHGGMGVVYRALQLKLKRVVALKMILASNHAGTQALERFRLEAEAVAGLQHPNIVQLYEVGEQDGRSSRWSSSMAAVFGGNWTALPCPRCALRSWWRRWPGRWTTPTSVASCIAT